MQRKEEQLQRQRQEAQEDNVEAGKEPETAADASGAPEPQPDAETAAPPAAAVKKKKKRRADPKDRKKADDKSFACATCKAVFPSRTALFQHLSDEGHAKPL